MILTLPQILKSIAEKNEKKKKRVTRLCLPRERDPIQEYLSHVLVTSSKKPVRWEF